MWYKLLHASLLTLWQSFLGGSSSRKIVPSSNKIWWRGGGWETLIVKCKTEWHCCQCALGKLLTFRVVNIFVLVLSSLQVYLERGILMLKCGNKFSSYLGLARTAYGYIRRIYIRCIYTAVYMLKPPYPYPYPYPYKSQKKGLFKMWIEHVRPKLLCLNLAPRGSPCSKLLTAPELEHSSLGRTCLIFCGVDPTFHHKIFTADHPLHQMAYFRVVWSCCNKQIRLQKKSSEKMVKRWSVWWCGSTCAVFP